MNLSLRFSPKKKKPTAKRGGGGKQGSSQPGMPGSRVRKRVGSSASSQLFDDEQDDSDDDLDQGLLSPHEISQLTDSLNKVNCLNHYFIAG